MTPDTSDYKLLLFWSNRAKKHIVLGKYGRTAPFSIQEEAVRAFLAGNVRSHAGQPLPRGYRMVAEVELTFFTVLVDAEAGAVLANDTAYIDTPTSEETLAVLKKLAAHLYSSNLHHVAIHNRMMAQVNMIEYKHTFARIVPLKST